MIPDSFPRVVDSSILNAWRSCRHRFFREYIQHWRPAGSNVHLHAGGAFATALETTRKEFANGTPAETSVARGIAALVERYGDFECPPDSAKSLDRMLGAFEFYFEHYPLETDECQIHTMAGIPGIEFSFAIPLPIEHPDSGEPLIFSGRTDAIVRYGGGLYALDDKTTSSLGATWARQWEMRGQFVGYAWAMREMGLKPAGTIARGISILKTKYDTAQAVVPQPDWKIQEWYHATLNDISEMIRHYTANLTFRKQFGESCNEYGGCKFKSTCVIQDPEPWFEQYFIKEEWNPLERH